MSTQPLSPEEVDALLRPDPRTASADLLVVRDALRRLGDAWEQLVAAAGQLEGVARSIEGWREREAERPRPAPRAD